MSLLLVPASEGAVEDTAGLRGLSSLASCSRSVRGVLLSSTPRWACVGKAARVAKKESEKEAARNLRPVDFAEWSGHGVLPSPPPSTKGWEGWKVISSTQKYRAREKLHSDSDTDARCAGAFCNGNPVGRWTDHAAAVRAFARREAATDPSVVAAALDAARAAFGL